MKEAYLKVSSECFNTRALADIAADRAFDLANAIISVPETDIIRTTAKEAAAFA